MSCAFIFLVSTPLSSRTAFISLGVPSLYTIVCVRPSHVVLLILGCIPPGWTFILSTFSASSATFLCEGALSKRKSPWAFGCTLSNMSVVCFTCCKRWSLLKYPSFYVSRYTRAWSVSSHMNPLTSSIKSETMMAAPRDFWRSTLVLSSPQK